MTSHSAIKAVLWTILGAATAACGSATPSPTGSGSAANTWDCVGASVPNGSRVECTATNAAALTASAPLPVSYYCPPDLTSPSCPPAGSGTTTPPAVDYDAGVSNPVGTMTGGVTGPDTDAAAPPPAADAGTTSGYDAGPVGQGGGGNGNGGNPHGGPPGNPGGGNPNGGPPGGGNPHTGGGGSADGGATVGPGDDGGGTVDIGGPGFTCDSSSSGSIVCTTPPSCAPGSHTSACGACVPDDSTDDCVPPSAGGCWITGGGFILAAGDNESFGGNAMPMKSGSIRGQWNDVEHANGDHMHGEPSYIVCRHVAEPGPGADNGPHHDFTINQAYFGGPARLYTNGAWADGYWFDVMVEDHGEGKGAKAGGPDYYHVTIRKMAGNGASGVVVHDAEASLSGGNIQIHPPNPGHPSAPSSLPAWVSLQP